MTEMRHRCKACQFAGAKITCSRCPSNTKPRKVRRVVLGGGFRRRSGHPVALDEFYIYSSLHINVFIRPSPFGLPDGEAGTLIWEPDPPKPRPKRDFSWFKGSVDKELIEKVKGGSDD